MVQDLSFIACFLPQNTKLRLMNSPCCLFLCLHLKYKTVWQTYTQLVKEQCAIDGHPYDILFSSPLPVLETPWAKELAIT